VGLNDNRINDFGSGKLNGKNLWMLSKPTAERMVLYISGQLSAALPKGFSIKRIRLFETDSWYAEYENPFF